MIFGDFCFQAQGFPKLPTDSFYQGFNETVFTRKGQGNGKLSGFSHCIGFVWSRIVRTNTTDNFPSLNSKCFVTFGVTICVTVLENSALLLENVLFRRAFAVFFQLESWELEKMQRLLLILICLDFQVHIPPELLAWLLPPQSQWILAVSLTIRHSKVIRVIPWMESWKPKMRKKYFSCLINKIFDSRAQFSSILLESILLQNSQSSSFYFKAY